MKVEILEPLRVKLPGGHVKHLPDGEQDLPDDLAEKLIAKAPSKVRPVTGAGNWLEAWRQIAEVAGPIRRWEPQYQPVLAALELCDRAFADGDWTAFRKAARQLYAAARVTKEKA